MTMTNFDNDIPHLLDNIDDLLIHGFTYQNDSDKNLMFAVCNVP